MLTPSGKTVDRRFQAWVMGRQAGATKYTEEQMWWLRKLRDHVKTSYRVEQADFSYTPFDAKGGLGKFANMFGVEMAEILEDTLKWVA